MITTYTFSGVVMGRRKTGKHIPPLVPRTSFGIRPNPTRSW